MVRVHQTAADGQRSPSSRTLLEVGRFGTVSRIPVIDRDERTAWLVERDTRTARWGLRGFARRRAAREARVLTCLTDVPGVPKLTGWDGRCLQRSWLEGESLSAGHPVDRAYFREALRLVRRMHARGVANNDLGRATNWLVTLEGGAALVGFAHARRPRYRGRRFRALACADLRDLLEHKRAYCGDALTARERKLLLRRPTWLERLWLRWARPRVTGLSGRPHHGSIVSNSSVGESPGRK